MSTYSWRDLANRLDHDCRFATPTTRAQIASAEASLKISFPAELCELLQVTDGINGLYGRGRIWPLARIVNDNIRFRSNPDFATLYMPFDPLLFIGDDGGGDQYAYRILAGRVNQTDVYVWQHESDSRKWFARDLRDYLARSSGHKQFDPARHGAPVAG